MSTTAETSRNGARTEKAFATRNPQDTAAGAVVLRRARPADTPALRRLAQLDEALPLAGEALLAEQGGELRAALSLHSGRAIADPFRHTADLVTLLRVRAALLRDERRPARPGLSLLRRVARMA